LTKKLLYRSLEKILELILMRRPQLSLK